MAESLKTVRLVVDQETILRYARITGDFNPLHVDPELAAKSAMGGVIAHGTLSMNLIWQSLSMTFGNDAAKARRSTFASRGRCASAIPLKPVVSRSPTAAGVTPSGSGTRMA